MTYTVYLLSSIGLPRNHHALFIQTNLPAPGCGHIFQVTGNIQTGMVYEDKHSTSPPEEDASFIDKVVIGTIDAPTATTATTSTVTATLDVIRSIVCAVPPPKKQFDGPRRLFPHEPIRRCQEWTEEATNALVKAGVLKQERGQ